MITNFQQIKEIKKKIKDEATRHEIIYLDTVIGSYEAREKEPENFIRERQVSGQVIESEYISKQREKTLKLLNEKPASEIIEKLIKKADLENSTIEKNGLFSLFKYFNSTNLMRKAGKRLETRMLNQGEKLKKEDDYSKKKIFYKEGNIIAEALFYELNEIR